MPPIEGPLTSGNSRHAIKLMIHIHICLTASRKTYDARMIENTIELAREALALTTKNSADRNYACLLLAESLGQRFDHHGEDSLLEEMISLKREVLTLSPEGHPGRASMCESLGISLWTRYKRTSDVTLLDEAIDLQREALSLRPPEHPSRYMSCENLGVILWTRYQRTGDVNLLDEAIYLQRGVLDFCPAGHPDRASSCGKLASLLKTLYESTGDIGILDEAINLQREALDTCLAGHPNRSMSYGNLANSLLARYERMGDVSLLNEVINLERQALDLRPAGNSYRYVSCGNLANSLWMHYQRVGDVGLLDEAIDLQREALDLCLAGQPDRSLYCGNLANSITTRYQRTGDASLLDEAIDLQREALDLCPSGHPDRSSWCTNLANSLKKRFERTGDVDLLDEAVYLQREALNLCPQGHPSRFLTCETLAHSLCACYVRTGEVGLLDEAIDLHRETLDFCPAEHPDRTMFCRNLAALLCLHYQRTGNVSTLDESLAYSQEGVATAPVHEVWRCLHILARTFLEKTSPGYDNSKVISCLSQSLKHDPDDPLEFVESLSSLLSNIWECNLEGEHIQLITIYQRLVNFLPLLVHPALGLQSQLQALKTCTRLGSDALVNAVLAKKTTVGFEILELAQGVIWSQSLHRRDPQLQDVPEHLASKLQGLLQSFARSSAAQPYDEERKWLTPRDTLHIRSSQADAVIREIRALPGLERFMLGETFETLRTTASNHPVVVLVGAHGHFYALLLAASLAKGHVVLSLDLSDENLTSLSFTRRSARARRSDVTSKETQEEGDRAGLKKTERASFKLLGGQLQTLWHKVVKPVLAHLGLEVSNQTSLDDTSILTNSTYVSRLGAAVTGHACIGVLLDSSAICLYTLQGSTTARTKSAALILWFHRTLRLSLLFCVRNKLPNLSYEARFPSPLWQRSELRSEISS
jgi:hypothetical protein